MPPANPDMLCLARESRMLTQGELALLAHVVQGTISKAENKQKPTTDELVERVAPILNYPLPFFYSDSWSIKNLPMPYFRKRIRVARKVERAVRAAMNLRRFELSKLLRSVEIPELRVPMLNAAEYQGDIERVARELRTQWHMRPGPVENLTTILESVGVVILAVDLGTKQIDGLSVYASDDGLPPVILMNPTLPGDRWRYTLAHELAHIVLHHHLDLPGEGIEEEANRFAGAFLMPAADIKGHLTNVSLNRLVAMKPFWKTSVRSLIVRAHQLDRISEWQYPRFFRQLNARYGGTGEPITLPREEPTLVSEIVRTHTHELGYSEPEMLELLGLNVNEYRSFYAPLAHASAHHLRAVK